MREPPGQVAADFDIDIADIHRALTYYYDHPDEMRTVESQWRTIPDGLRVVRDPDDLDGRSAVSTT
jgi:hypothetical protein